MNKSIIAAFAAASVLFGHAALANPDLTPQKHGQYYKSEQLFIFDTENARGGKGTMHGEFAFRREQARPQDAIIEIGWMTLKPGAYIGGHAHEGNEDAYIIFSGKGISTDGNNNAWVVKPGDMIIARAGQSHSLANLFNENLVFIRVIAKNDATKKMTSDQDAGGSTIRETYPWLFSGQVDHTKQYYRSDELLEHNIENFHNGSGMAFGKYAFYHDAAKPGEAFKEIGIMTLKTGASIGTHLHKDDENAYIFLSGEGVFTDGSGQEMPVTPMTITITGPNQSHALRNDKEHDLVFITVNAKNQHAGM